MARLHSRADIMISQVTPQARLSSLFPGSGARAPRDPGALEALRSATGPLHARLDSGLPLARPDAGPADYVAHLEAIVHWLEHLAPWLAQAGVDDRYLQAARADLAGAAAGPGLRGPLVPPAPQDSPAFAWGVAYVVEGSQLGGQVLHRRLHAALAPLPLRYLQGRGAATGAHWKYFLEQLGQAVSTPAEIDAACAGAVWAFQTLINNYNRMHAFDE